MHILEPDPEVGDCPCNGLLLYYLTRVHATNRVIACSLICNRNLACGGGARLGCCSISFAAGDPSTTIIMLGKLYFVLSCWLAPTNAALVQHRRHAAVRP
jgi:hypothetical protein